MLPLSPEEAQRANCRHNILVSLTGSELDRELVTVACNLGKIKKFGVVGVYGIQVPLSLPVDAELDDDSRRANDALDRASALAQRMHVDLEPEIIQSRHFGQSLVDESLAHDCAVVILGVPYHLRRGGQFALDETVDFVLKNAPCRVWVVRGEPPERSEQRTEQRPEQLERAGSAS